MSARGVLVGRILELAVHEAHGCCVIAASGEIDVATVRQLEDALEHSDEGSHLVVLDLRNVTFIDSSGLRPIIEANTVRGASSRRLVIDPSPAVSRFLEVAGVGPELEVLGEAEGKPREARRRRRTPFVLSTT